ncbi:hypothetical protein [Dapis sp. BLCC M126]|uniref:hypothetical protein n=1 Tax=Dapis sp. BLCC M126 TaxID=3400189 RepID=UPI003CEF6C4E
MTIFQPDAISYQIQLNTYYMVGGMGGWGDGEMGRWGDGEMGRWGDGEMGRWRSTPNHSPVGNLARYLLK